MSDHGDSESEVECLWDLLSDELVTEILTRIPSKPLCRFKSVSKYFNSIITHPHFLFSYISRPSSSWVILDRLPRLAPDSPLPTQFELVDRPGLSTSSINPKKLASEPVTDPFWSKYPTTLLQSSNGLILFTLLIKRDPHKEHAKNPNCFSSISEENALYVVNPLTREWVGLPKPYDHINNRFHVGFTTRVDPKTGFVERFMAAEYRTVTGLEIGTLMCFSSDLGKWVEKKVNYMLRDHVWRGEKSFEFEGKLFWVDLSAGLITWDDPFESFESKERAVCRFIPVPDGRRKHSNTPGLEKERCVDVGGGFIQYMEVFKEKQHCVFKVWWLKKNCEEVGEWDLMYKVSRDVDADRLLTCKAQPLFVDPFVAEVVYFRKRDCMFSFNLRTHQVESRGGMDGQRFVFPFVLPKWPSPIPKRLYAAYAKEEGNGYFKGKNFTEAIKCYSKSIGLSPNAATFANRAIAYLKMNKFHEAENDCTESLTLDATCIKVYWRRAVARKEVGDLEGALEDVESGLKLEPENEEVKKLYAELKPLLEKVPSAGHEYDGSEGAASDRDVERM